MHHAVDCCNRISIQPYFTNTAVLHVAACLCCMVCSAVLDRQGFSMTFLGWMRVGIPVTIATVAVANLYMFRYCF
jgi:hypothetical protein